MAIGSIFIQKETDASRKAYLDAMTDVVECDPCVILSEFNWKYYKFTMMKPEDILLKDWNRDVIEPFIDRYRCRHEIDGWNLQIYYKNITEDSSLNPRIIKYILRIRKSLDDDDDDDDE